MIKFIRKILGIGVKARKPRTPNRPPRKAPKRAKARRDYIGEAVAETARAEKAEHALAMQRYNSLNANHLNAIVGVAIENARHEAQSNARQAATIAVKQGKGRSYIIRVGKQSAEHTYRTAIEHAIGAYLANEQAKRESAKSEKHKPRNRGHSTKTLSERNCTSRANQTWEVEQIRAELGALRRKHGQLTQLMRNVTYRGGKKSKNADYHDTKEQLIAVEDRMQFYQNALMRANGVRSNKLMNIVEIGSTVVIRYEESNEDEVYRIVSTPLGKGSESTISAKSPTGSAILGQQVGANIHVQTPSGPARIRIIEVR
ncbi:MAG: GreA/GreB family elongation factor [Chloroflexi bacterium]|nr:GreA/GreB family elongation factor [Chloroflexota bacterium]